MISHIKQKLGIMGIILLILLPFVTLYYQIDFVTAQDQEMSKTISIPCPSLNGSLINNGDTQNITVLFPIDYSDRNEYPVIYYFPGFLGELDYREVIFT